MTNDGDTKAEKMDPSTVGGHVIYWSVDVIIDVLETDDVDLVRWLHENIFNGDDEQDIDREILYLLRERSPRS
ncbi:hypothetical protein GQ600_12621 [Phytophthora cactorum]|nr:hypothetical protein GQ600_12621 [Phytophthora cactorum]